MNLNYSKSLGLIAVLYFTVGVNAQVADSLKEKKIEEVVVINYGSVKKKNATSAISRDRRELVIHRTEQP
ncbi:hypothetical protein OK344_08760 [Kaistella sp. BT6-1-3]|uniref:Uncharacterized protein n=1 Tax=Kaistella yananensis TaxID=2989820 RepID=A0ABT3JNG4_9FLAO|nr:hypothetical protein [Kaistella yananensis]MCW4452298.1 hypothetical protein [Kaistella yananensis]